MPSLNLVLRSIELEFQKDPDKIWEYLRENDLLITLSAKKDSRYIICVREYMSEHKLVHIKFIYSITTDTFYVDYGWEYPNRIDRAPSNGELVKLTKNFDYLKFISNK